MDERKKSGTSEVITDDNGSVEIDIIDLAFYLLKRWYWIAAVALVFAACAAFYSYFFITPVYESTAQLYVVSSSESVINLSDLQIGTYLTSDYQLVFDTWEVNEKVIEELQLPYSVDQLRGMVRVSNPSSTRALLITASSTNAQEAANIANVIASYASKYIAKTMKSEEPTTLSMALKPLSPVYPRKTRMVVIAAFLGAIAAGLVLVLIYVLDDKIKTSQDLIKYTGVAPLAIIPIIEAERYERSKR